MRLAFIGASHWHLSLYLEPAVEVPGATIVGVSDPDPVFVADLAAKLGCVGDIDYRELCRRMRPDFVIALGRHCDMLGEAAFLIEEGIPFAIEKPCGLNHGEVARLAALVAAKGSFAAVPLVFRNGDFLPRLQDMAAEGIQYMSYRFIGGFPSRYEQANCHWMLDPRLSGGGCTINLSPHFLDLAVQVMGDDIGVKQATLSNAAWGLPIEDYSAVMLESGSSLCLVESGYVYPAPTSTFDMHYAVRSRERYLIARDPDAIEITSNAGAREIIPCRTTNVPHYRSFVHDAIERVRKGRPPLAGIADMVPIMRLCEEAYAKAGRLPLRVPPA
jgi:predicted dehydrogenase